MTVKHRGTFPFFILTIIFLLSGCWSQKELTDIMLVSALGIDKNEEGKYVLTLQLINPGNVATGTQPSGQASPVTVFSSTGDNIVEASRRATKKVSRRLYYAHTNLVVVSEKLVREEGLINVLDALERDPEFRTTTTIVIAQGRAAGDIVKIITPVDKIPANKVIKTLQSTEKRWGELITVNIQDLINNSVSPGIEPVISGFRLKGDVDKGKKLAENQQTTPDVTLEASSLGIFKNGKLISWLQGEKARGVVFLRNKLTATAIAVDWKGKKQSIVYQIVRQKTKVSARKTKQNLPAITVEVRTEGDIGEVSVPIDLTDPTIINEIEKIIEKEIRKEIQSAVQFAQEKKTDVFGFGESVHLADPKAWKKLKNDWDDVNFPQLKVNVKVDAFIRRTGIRSKPYFSSMGKSQ
ncbi:Ger(x)C family spore germination protein [Schinkia sp. CFF1]